MALRTFVPVWGDHFQSPEYRLDRYEERDGALVAIFGDGSERASCYPHVAALLAAGARDWMERVREVK